MILSIETSTKICSVALHNKGELLAESTLYVDKSHAEKLAVLIKDLISYADITTKDLTAVAIASGPGSYTGLRIGTSTAKGLCYALNIPLMAVNTLEAMAYGVTQTLTKDYMLCPMLDARRMEVYCMLTDKELKIIKPVEAKIIDENSFSTELITNKIVFFGNGAAKCKAILGGHSNVVFINNQSISAVYIGKLAWQKYKENKFEDLAYFEPEYLKEFKAIKPKNLFA
ncbi:MAG: tRNA (adenosine(37)-N6)-threonylcarbamoyltransferase complex dimerization subunit type 1 TsaB [Cyclobacteriaceae bacterium]|nr:tRNA (adenosine(37)-N6)-threonylcarbamoyltransferase complex dimerization subunit type 1 TsaB [Cyclobacteriaceae bacterium]